MELVRFPSSGGFSVRSIITFCLTVIATALLWVVLGGTPAHAVEANWSGDVILYDHHGYPAAPPTTDPSHGLPTGSTLYLYIPTVDGSTSNSDSAYFIYFAPGVDPPTATSANYVAYSYKNGKFSNPHDQKTLVLTLKGSESTSSSCSISGGLGWIICPATLYLAESMDSLFNIMEGMLAVQPLTLQTGADNGLYTAWSIMRSVANVAFVIAFLIIIFSQLTSIGVSNYGLKKLIPRLIVAAVLVNVSFYVAAVAIDLSNVAGYSIQDLFHAIREQTFHMTDDTFGSGVASSNWTLASTAILGGGGLLIGGTYAFSSGAAVMLVPLLLGLVLTVLMVIIILAARQAIIILLVILAPLAFVANLLPNTEKLFDKWRSTFITMLVFFPIFSLAFAGAQLAGQLIVKNAGDNLVMVLFGMAVQVAPLVVTPLILKTGGSLLGKIAGIVNNPSKGLLDRNRKWASDRRDLYRARNAGRDLSNRSRINPTTWGKRMVKASEFRKRDFKMKQENAETEVGNRHAEARRRYTRLHEAKAAADIDRKRITAQNDAHLEDLKVTSGSRLNGRTVRTQEAEDRLTTTQNTTATYINDLRRNPASPLNASTLQLEGSKATLETSDNLVKRYIAQQKTLASGALHYTVEPLERSKLQLEQAQSDYTTLVETLKAPGGVLSNVAYSNQASKEALEIAQSRVQEGFAARRQVTGSELNLSMYDLEHAKVDASDQAARAAALLNTAKTQVGNALHTATLRAEDSKLAQQTAETAVNRMIEEYKSGLREDVPEGELTAIMQSMKAGVQNLAAETRGVQSAQNMQKQHIAEAFTGKTDSVDPDAIAAATARADELLTVAGSVDPNGRRRAQASSTAQIASIEKEARDNNKILLEAEADAKGTRGIDYAKAIFKKYRNDPTIKPEELALVPGDIDEAMLETALDYLADDGAIREIRDAVTQLPDGSPLQEINQPLMRRIIARNGGALMSKGGSDLVLNNLSDVSPDAMRISIAGSLGGISGDKITGMKFAWWNEFAKEDTLDQVIRTVEAMDPDEKVFGRDRESYQEALTGFYDTITDTLRNPDLYDTLNPTQRLQTQAIHQRLHSHYAKPSHTIDYASLGRRVRPPAATPEPPADTTA